MGRLSTTECTYLPTYLLTYLPTIGRGSGRFQPTSHVLLKHKYMAPCKVPFRGATKCGSGGKVLNDAPEVYVLINTADY